MLFGVCMKYMKNEEDAKDCVQQIFLKVIKELPRYQVTYFKSWIYTIARNHCLMALRDRKQILVEWNDQSPVAMDTTDAGDNAEQKEKKLLRLEAAIMELKPEQQQCIQLFYLQKKSYVEISSITGFSPMQVKSFLQNGKRRLEILMKNQTTNQSIRDGQ